MGCVLFDKCAGRLANILDCIKCFKFKFQCFGSLSKRICKTNPVTANQMKRMRCIGSPSGHNPIPSRKATPARTSSSKAAPKSAFCPCRGDKYALGRSQALPPTIRCPCSGHRWAEDGGMFLAKSPRGRHQNVCSIHSLGGAPVLSAPCPHEKKRPEHKFSVLIFGPKNSKEQF